MKLTIGKKITIGLVTAGLLASAFVATFFGVKNAKEKASEKPGPSVITPVQPDDKTDDQKQDDQKQDDNKQDDQKQDEDKKTEQDYMNECQERIETIALEKLQSTSKRGTFDNINILKINELDGKVYFTADKTLTSTTKYFHELDLGKSFVNSTYEESLKTLNSISSVSGTELTTQTVLQESVSEELYNQLCDYVLDKVGLEGAQILNATEFSTNKNAMYETTLSVFKNNKMYQVSASVISDGSQEDHINTLMTEGRTKEIKITNEENFKEFVTESTAEASAQSNVVYFDITFPSLNSETNKETTKTLTVRQTNGKADYRGLSL